MIPAHCRVRHDPPETYGDCVRAAVASVMELNTDDVPHFYCDNNGVAGLQRLREWLGLQGLAPYFIHLPDTLSLDDILSGVNLDNPGIHYILFGNTGDGDHCVVCCDGEVVHNPSWYPLPLIKACSNGYWSILLIVRK